MKRPNFLTRACLSAVFAAAAVAPAAMAQNPAASLPDAPVPQAAAAPAPVKPPPVNPFAVPTFSRDRGFIDKTIDFFEKHAVDDRTGMYDFAMQQRLKTFNWGDLLVNGGTLQTEFGNPRALAERSMYHAVLGPDVSPGLMNVLTGDYVPNRAAGDGFAVGLSLRF